MEDIDDIDEAGMMAASTASTGKEGRKHTMSEKLTGVRNSQSDKFLSIINKRFDTQLWNVMRNHQAETNRIKMDYQTLQVDQKRNEIEIKKRTKSDEDTTQDEIFIQKSEKYLKYNEKDSFYLKKGNAARLRTYSSGSKHITPIIAQARKTMQDNTIMRNLNKQKQKRLSAHTPRIVQTAHTVRFQDENEPNADGTFRDNEKQRNKLHMPAICSGIFNLTEADLNNNNNNKTSSAPGPSDHNGEVQLIKINPDTQPTESSESRFTYDSDLSADQRLLPGSKSLPNLSATNTDMHRDSQKSNKDTIREKLAQLGIGQPLRKSGEFHWQRKGSLSASFSSQHPRKQVKLSHSAGKQRPPLTHDILYKEQIDIQQKINRFFITLEETKELERQQEIKRHAERVKRLRRLRGEIDSSDSEDEDCSNDLATVLAKHDTAVPKTQQSKAQAKGGGNWDKINTRTLLQRKPNDANELPSVMPSYLTMPAAQFVTAKTSTEDSTISARHRPLHPKPQRGIPNHSATRSQRHTATFKLHKVVQQILRDKSKRELMEIDKLKEEMSSNAATNEVQVL